MGDITEKALNEKLGYIVMDGYGTLFGTLSGYTCEVLHKFSDGPKVPKIYERGEAANRSARLRLENYVRKTAELATHYFINPSTSEPNVDGLVLAGKVDWKSILTQSDKFDPQLAAKIVNVVNVICGGEMGFEDAIQRTSKILLKEKRLLMDYFEEIGQDTGKFVFGLDDTLNVLESKSGAVEKLIVWENLDINRYVMKNRSTGETVIKHLNKEQEGNTENFKELDVEEKMSLVDWLANEHIRFGCAALEFVTNRSNEGFSFCRGLGGIGGKLRYPVDLSAFDSVDGKLNKDEPPPSLNQPARAHLKNSMEVIGEASFSKGGE